MTKGGLLYKSHGDVCQKIIAPKKINMGVAQVLKKRPCSKSAFMTALSFLWELLCGQKILSLCPKFRK